jgi:hypothetical protein
MKIIVMLTPIVLIKQQLIILAFLATCAADSFAQAIKCVDPKGKVVYSNTQCPDSTRLEKSVGSPSVITGPVSPPNEDRFGVIPQADIDAVRLNSRRLLNPFSSLTPTEAETQAKLEGLQSQLEQLKLEQDDAQEAADKAMEEAKDRAEQARQEAEDQAKKVAEAAEDEAADLRSKILRAEIRRSNNLYLGGFLLLVVCGSFYVIKKNKVGGIMNANQKYGVAIIVLSLLLLILALMISDGWISNLDFLGNLMQFLHIQFIEIKGDCEVKINCTHDHYFIDIPTKYVVLAFISTAAYGLTTYLGITPAFMPWKKPLSNNGTL